MHSTTVAILASPRESAEYRGYCLNPSVRTDARSFLPARTPARCSSGQRKPQRRRHKASSSRPHSGVLAPAPISLSAPSAPHDEAEGGCSKASCSCVASSSPENRRQLASRAAYARIQSYILGRVLELL